jgi:hypothetical protein
MRMAKTTLYICIVLLVQWVIVITLPFLFFEYLARADIYPYNPLIDEVIKAILSFTLVGIWLYEWMKMGEYVYKFLSKTRFK